MTNVTWEWESNIKFQEGTELFLSQWSFFRNNILLDNLWRNKLQLLETEILSFFATSGPDPGVERLAMMLRSSINIILKHLLRMKVYFQAAKKILRIYERCNKGGFSMEKFQRRLQVFMAEWPEIQNTLYGFQSLQILPIGDIVYLFFARTDEPDVDGIAAMLRHAIATSLEISVEPSTCKMAAQELFDIYQNCVDQNFEYIEELRKETTETMLEDEEKREQQQQVKNQQKKGRQKDCQKKMKVYSKERLIKELTFL